MILYCDHCEERLEFEFIGMAGNQEVHRVKPCDCQVDRIRKLKNQAYSNDTEYQRCWYLENGVWEVGLLHTWSSDNGETVGIIEPTNGPMKSVYVGDITFGDCPNTDTTIAKTLRDDGHVRVYLLPKKWGKLEKVAVQLEPNALTIVSLGDFNYERGRLTKTSPQGTAIWRDGKVECDAPDIDIEALEEIFKAAGCE